MAPSTEGEATYAPARQPARKTGFVYACGRQARPFVWQLGGWCRPPGLWCLPDLASGASKIFERHVRFLACTRLCCPEDLIERDGWIFLSNVGWNHRPHYKGCSLGGKIKTEYTKLASLGDLGGQGLG